MPTLNPYEIVLFDNALTAFLKPDEQGLFRAYGSQAIKVRNILKSFKDHRKNIDEQFDIEKEKWEEQARTQLKMSAADVDLLSEKKQERKDLPPLPSKDQYLNKVYANYLTSLSDSDIEVTISSSYSLSLNDVDQMKLNPVEIELFETLDLIQID